MQCFARSKAARWAAFLLTALLAAAFAGALAPASAHAQDAAHSPCIATVEQRAAYAADGTLDEREAFQESLGNDEPSPGLVQQALAREQAQNGIAPNAVPGDDGGMAAIGNAHVVALRVSFPDRPFAEGDTLEALQTLIGPRAVGEAALPSAGGFPYENLHDYYLRASYGALTVTGEAFDYAAQHERDFYTANIGQLYKEALDHLEASGIDLARFDANGDGRIDAVYLHFAGGDTGWGSVWWSNEQVLDVPDAVYADGTVRLWNAVALSNPCDQPWAAQTIIHETGHVLGLPDYYQYASQQGGSTDRTGILTFDIMMQNQGDHNGFSKWMLGWLPDSKITRIFANETGIDVKRDGKVVQHVDATADGSSSVEAALEAFASNDIDETGGIVVVANQDASMFSSYYLLQYDRFAGNQSVRYEQDGQPAELPSGFRLFRVQADLGSGGPYFVHSNTYGTVHNQLIELVDPDMNEPHAESTDLVPAAIGSREYGCMLYAGDEVSPRGYPSTNFFENANVGFTGLTIAVTESRADGGTLNISYSNAGKPEPPDDFTLTPLFDSVSNTGTLSFEASTKPALATPLPAATQLIVDGQPHALLNIETDGTTVSLPYFLDAGDIGPSSTCEIVFPAGMFVLAQTGGTTAYSPEVRLELKASPLLTPVDCAGGYLGTEYTEDSTALSNVFACPDGSKRFFQIADGQLKLHAIDPADVARVSSRTVEGVPVPAVLDYRPSFRVVPLSNETAFVLMPAAGGESAGYWIDLQRGTVIASYPFDQAASLSLAGSGSTVLAASFYPGGGRTIAALTPLEDGTVEARYGWTQAETVVPVDADAFAFGFMDDAGALTEEARILPADAIVAALRDGATLLEHAADNGELCTPERAAATLPLRASRMLLAVERAKEGFYALLSSDYLDPAKLTNLLIEFDSTGAERARSPIEVDGSDVYMQLRVARHGTVALSRRIDMTKPPISRSDVLFCDVNLQPLSVLTTASTGLGTWLDDGRWLDVGMSVAAANGPKGSPVATESGGATEGGEVDESKRARYVVTTQLDKTPANPGDDPADPGIQPQPLPQPADDQPDSPSKLAPTGDRANALALAALATAALATALLALMRQNEAKEWG